MNTESSFRQLQVRDKMLTQLSTVDPEAKAAFAFIKMVQYGFRHLPVMTASGELFGIVSYGDLREALQLKAHHQHLAVEQFETSPHVRDVCTRRVTSVTPDTDLRKAARIMVQRKFGALPVIDENSKLVGMITESDLLSVFIEMLDEKYGS